jgi:hypothetical protein
VRGLLISAWGKYAAAQLLTGLCTSTLAATDVTDPADVVTLTV